MSRLLSRSLPAAFALALLAPLSPAGTLTVGPAGSGAQFTEIQAAIDAALANDVILVRPGTYQRIVVDKPLRILGDGTGIVRISGGSGVGATLRNIAAGAELVLSGVEVPASSFLEPSILLQNSPGTLILQSVVVAHTDEDIVGVQVDNCARVVLLDSRIVAGSYGFQTHGAVWARGSEVWLSNTVVHGTTDGFSGGSYGVEVILSTLHVWRSPIHGGGDNIVTFPKSGGRGGAAIKAVGSRVNLFGGPGSELQGGGGTLDPLFPFSYPGGPGLDLTQNSRARIQALIPIAGGLDGELLVRAPAIQADASSTFTLDPKIFPTLASSAQRVQLGSTFTLTLTGNQGGYQVLFFSFVTGPTTIYRAVDGFGLLDRPNMRRLASEVLPSSGAYTLSARVPNMASLIGTTVFLQAAEQLGTSYAIGNPVVVTITG